MNVKCLLSLFFCDRNTVCFGCVSFRVSRRALSQGINTTTAMSRQRMCYAVNCSVSLQVLAVTIVNDLKMVLSLPSQVTLSSYEQKKRMIEIKTRTRKTEIIK